ncbi:hypothetical protein PFISCL1PPCAC_26735, partial [Pristionchus fissidentatus]
LLRLFAFIHSPHEMIRLKAAFAALQFVAEAYAFYIARRCHSYIKFTADSLDEKDAEMAVAVATTGNPLQGCSLSSEFHEMRRVPSLIVKGRSSLGPSPLSLPAVHCHNGAMHTTRLANMQPQTDC